MALLEIRNVSVSYQQAGSWKEAVKEADLTIEAQKSYGLIGESGSGKTSLMMAVLGLLDPNTSRVQGEIRFKGKSLLESNNLHAVRWKDLAVVFQNSMNALSPVHRIKDQIYDIYRLHQGTLSKKQINERSMEIFDRLNLKSEVWRAYPHELSGGMMQRVSIALSLLFNPSLIIFDEATTALDIITQNKILHELKALNKVYQNSKIFVTHDLAVVKQACDYVYIMLKGRIIEEGSVEKIFYHAEHPYTQKLVENFNQLRGVRAIVSQ